MGFWLNAIYGFAPHFNINKDFSICNDQIHNKDSGVFVISSDQSKDVYSEIKKVKNILKNCSFKINETNVHSGNIFYFTFYK